MSFSAIGHRHTAREGAGTLQSTLMGLLKGLVGLVSGKWGHAGGNCWYADSVNGVAGNDGNSWEKACLTIAAAVAKAAAGDTIYIKGSFTEVVTVSLVGLRIIGVGTGPKQAQWGSATDTKTLTIAANYVHIENVYFLPPARTAGTPASIQLSGANHARILGCRFHGQFNSPWYGIYSPVCDSDNVLIADCEFFYFHTTTYGKAIFGVEAGGLSYSTWRILRCHFFSCVVAIDINGRGCLIKDCTIAEYGINPAGAVAAILALGIDLSGTSSGANSVWGNQLHGTYDATLYKVGAGGDCWAGNFNPLTGGVTAANPV